MTNQQGQQKTLTAKRFETSSSGALSTRGTWTYLSESRGGHGDAARAGAALLWSQAERAGLVQPGQEKAPGSPASLQEVTPAIFPPVYMLSMMPYGME